MTTSTKPHLKLIDGVPLPTDKLAAAERRFGRPFAHQRGTSFLRHPEPVLNRWARNADYLNLDPQHPPAHSMARHWKQRK